MKQATKLVGTIALSLIAFSAWGSRGGSSTQDKNVGTIHGWTPDPNTIPSFGCTDDSYENAVKNGITVGAAQINPYFVSDHGKYSGIDYEVVNAAAAYAGIKNVKWKVVSQYSNLIPAVLSRRIDMVGETIHQTPKRAKNVAFTSASYWYGPSMAVQKGNPKHITSYDDLSRPNLKIGVLSGSGGATYVTERGIAAKHFTNESTMQLAVSEGLIDLSIQSEAVARLYLRSKPNANLSVIAPPVPEALTKLGFTYSRYIVRKDACSLNLALSRALTDLRQHGVIYNILRKYPGYHVYKMESH